MKNLLKVLIAVICTPVLIFCGCSKSNIKIPKVDASVYLENEVKYTTFNNSKEQKLELTEFLITEADPANMRNFEKITITAKNAWIYKMYIEKICFNFHSNKVTTSEIVVKLTISNVAKEEEIGTENAVHTKELVCSLVPKANGYVECEYEINETVAVATGSTITIDINESINNELIESDFRWTIFNLSIFGEHRAY